VNVGVDPMDFANMVSEAKRVVQESDERIKGLEGLAQDVYSQACSRIQELLGVVESLQLSNQGFQNQIHQLNSEVANVRAQLELQITWNHDLGSRVECSASMLDHKEGEISRLMDEIHQLKDSVDSQRLVLEAASTLSRYGDEFGCTKRRSTS
jgi:predicted  nucleic acid-binding Zn-ribbon protein